MTNADRAKEFVRWLADKPRDDATLAAGIELLLDAAVEECARVLERKAVVLADLLCRDEARLLLGQAAALRRRFKP